jgi:hypothetical protein
MSLSQQNKSILRDSTPEEWIKHRELFALKLLIISIEIQLFVWGSYFVSLWFGF